MEIDMTDCIVFDIDGTLSDPSHRLHHVTNGKRDWDAFFAGMGEDQPKDDVIWLNRSIHEAYYEVIPILIVTARPENYRNETVSWLRTHHIGFDHLYMRPAGDHRADDVVKSEILDQIIADGYRVRCWVDDRTRVVDKIRSRGITVLQCASWEDRVATVRQPTLTVMVGPSGAGKSSRIRGLVADGLFDPGAVISSDSIRYQLTGDSTDQSQNDAVFLAAHAITRARLRNGLDVVFDATNLHRKDRLAVVGCAKGTEAVVRYVVIDRPLAEKMRDRGWRPEWLVEKHHQRMQSVVKDVLRGDGVEGIEVVDLRVVEGVA
jgi:predicted kinase